MAQYDGKVTISTALDNSGFKNGINNMKGNLGGLSGVLGKLGLAVSAAFAVKKVVEFGAACVKLGSDVAEVQNVVDVAFGSMSNKMEQFADTAITSYGMSKLAAKKTGSNYMAMAKGMGVASDAASDMAVNLTGLSGDVASFYNVDQTDAATKLKSVFTGETESLKEIGVVMTQANLQQYALTHGMNSNIAAMSQAELVALRYAFVMDSLALAQGDFARTQNSWANQTRILSMQWQEFMSIIGQALTTILLPLVKVLNTIVSALIRMANAFNAAIQSIFGGSRTVVAESGGTAAAADLATATGSLADSSGAAAAGQDALADSTKAAAAAAKKSLASFDELNVLQGKDSAGSGGAGGGGGGGGLGGGGTGTGDTISTSEIGDAENKLSKLQELFNQLKNSFMDGLKLGWGDAGEGVKNILADLGNIKKTLGEIFNDPQVSAAANRLANSVAKALGSIVGSVASIGVSIAENLVGGFSRYLDGNKEFIKGSLTAIFNIGADLADMIGGTAAAVATVFRSLGSEGGKNLTAGLMGILNNGLLGMIQTFGQTLYTILNTCLFGPFIDNADKIREVFSNLFEVVAPLFEGIATGIGEFYTSLNQFYQSVIKPAAEFLEKIFSGLLGGALDNINRILEKLTGAKDALNAIGKVLGWLIGGISAVAAAFGAIKVALGIFAAIQGAIDLVIGAVAGIGTAFAGIGTILSGLMGTASLATGAVSSTGVAVGLLSNPVGIAIAAIGALVAAGIFLYKNWDTIKEKAGQLKDWIQTTWSDIKEKVGSTVSKLKTDVETKWENLTTNVETNISAFKEKAATKWDSICTATSERVTAGVTTVQGHWDGMCEWMQNTLTGFATTASGIWTGICNTASSLVSGASIAVQGLWSGMCNLMQGVLNGFALAASGIWTGISTTASGLVSGASIAVQGLWSGMCNLMQGVLSGFAIAASGIWTGISTTASSLVSGACIAVQGLWSGMCTALGSLMSSLQGMFTTVWSAITGIVSGAVRGIISTVQSMIQTIQGAISSVMSALSSLGSRAASAVSSARDAAASVFSRSADTAAMSAFAAMPVPALATGAVIPPNKQFLAVLGDQTSGTNIEAPLDTIKQAVAEVMAGMTANADGTPINIYLGNELLDSFVASSQRRQALRSGGR